MHKEDDQFDSEEGARPSSLRPVHKLSIPDPLYDQQLLRDLAIINERTRKELGPPPHRAEPVQAKRKLNVPGATETAKVITPSRPDSLEQEARMAHETSGDRE